MDWEVYKIPGGYRAELYRGADPSRLAVIRSRWKPVLHVRMAVVQWRHQ